ncbi:MAG: SDR family NAD(P)-dependent oxidoreductase [Aliifodinibius sp.]|nr:SDR family NAD(P)-dependent oxidoreductase [candidate division Zixibacteria bacterium]NIT57326.1 SDR family NAD(P)-dependent oxidoreductase [Fodinibius sp.]NIW45151.1 SDR family NAD(P)-dependent oxidoreductase [Gammaproteobacteria bacterium]NIS46185.1 SDR family NAD(P)-dependent oxidoreductase [candidate division Zixibacteria bacterium]NIU14287.1 SDR family NAD(P)-dependent oxidoreductase [candidate division Zixibacteria bacterium]
MKKRIVIVGATSGIGRALAFEMHKRGYIVGATGRRVERLQELEHQLQSRIYTQFMDVVELDDTINQLDQLKKDYGGNGYHCTQCRRFELSKRVGRSGGRSTRSRC